MIQTKVTVQLKEGVLDPEGETISKAALNMGFSTIQKVIVQKCFQINVETKNSSEALKTADQFAQQLLVNPVIESFRVEIDNGIS